MSEPDLIEPEIWGRSSIPLGDPAFTADGRLVVSHHPAFRTEVRVSVFAASDRTEPYPNTAMNAGDGSLDTFDSVQGLRTDSAGVLWMTDLGHRDHATPKIVGWDTRAHRHHRTIPLPPPATHRHSEPQDLVIDERRGKIYVADEGAGRGGDGSKSALIVVDIASGESRRVLEGAACTRPEDVEIVVDGRVLQAFDEATATCRNLRVGVDGIALDTRGEWLYFGPLNGGRIYRLRCDDLNDPAAAKRLEDRVEDYAGRPNAGGLWIDDRDDLYLVEIENRAVGVIPAADRRYRRVARHAEMFWPDGLIGGPDGYIYVTASELPFSPPFNGGSMTGRPPYKVFRFRPPRLEAGGA